MAAKKNFSIYGFEQYKLIWLGYDAYTINYKLQDYNYNAFHHWAEFSNSRILYLKNEHSVPEINCNVNIEELYPENKDLLNTTQTIYIHPSCNISRNVVLQKYKKTLNPWLADAVVIPKPTSNHSYDYKAAIFISEKAQMIFHGTLPTYHEPTMAKFSEEGIIGKPLRDFLIANEWHLEAIQSRVPYNIKDLLDAELIYVGDVYAINHDSVLNDLVQNTIPKSKIIYEDTIMNSLSSDENQLSVESLTSISEMLNSPDKDTVNSALKALSTMDYMHYPNSVILVLKESWDNYKYNKVMNSTAVKYMMTHFCGTGRRRWRPNFADDFITQKDYEVFKGLLDTIKIDGKNYMLEYECSFLYKDGNLEYQPRIMN